MTIRNSHQYFLFLLSFYLISPLDLLAQFGLSAEIRPRTEYRHGYRTLPEPSENGVFLITQRTRLQASYNYENKVRSYLALQDIRVWGQDGLNTRSGNLGLYQAWLDFDITSQMSLQLGRQEFEYDDLRILSNSNWRLQARAHDAGLLKFHSKDSTFKFHVAAAFNNDTEALFEDFFEINNYKNLAFVWANKNFGNTTASILLLNQGFQAADSSINHAQNLGFYFTHKAGKWSFSGSYYHQTGTDNLDRSINAYMASLQINLQASEKLKPFIGFDLLSGTGANQPADETSTFIPWYARRHRYFGIQDMFYAGGFIVQPGLTDVFGGVQYKINNKANAKLTAHSFSTQRTLINPENNNEMDRNLGGEIDFIFNYQYNKIFKIQAGYAQFFATETMEILKQRGSRNEVAHFIYISFDFNPVFL